MGRVRMRVVLRVRVGLRVRVRMRVRLRVVLRVRVRPAPLVVRGRRARGRFSSSGWRRRAPLWGRSRGRRGVVGYGRVQLG